MTRDPTLAEVNIEIRRIKRLIKINEEVIKGLKLIDKKLRFIPEMSSVVESQKEYLKCLEHIKEKLS